jgi:hypothetical protein
MLEVRTTLGVDVERRPAGLAADRRPPAARAGEPKASATWAGFMTANGKTNRQASFPSALRITASPERSMLIW